MIFSLVVIFAMLLAACAQATPTEEPAAEEPAAEEPAAEEPAAEEPSGEKPTLRVWITWGDNPAQLQELFNKYGAANNVTVEVTAPVEDDKVIAALSGSEPPDVLILGGPDSVGSWQREGLVTELDPYIESANIDLNDIFSAPLDQCKYQGILYCLPWGTDIYALFWNKDLFEDAGLYPEKPPQTLEELTEYADKLTLTDDAGSLTQIGFIPDFSWSHSDLYVRMFGGFWYSEDGTQLTFTSQPMIDQLTWQQQFYTQYNVDEVLKYTSALGGYMSPDQGFYAGKVAMMVDGEWQTGPNFISNFKPELNYGVAPLPPPASNPERANTGVVAGTVALIPSGVQDKEAAAKLLAWMMTPEIMAEEMCANYNLPTSKQAVDDPCFTENPKFVVFMDLLGNPNATHSIYTAINAEVNEALGQIEEQVLHAGADPLPLLEEAQTQLQPSLDETLK
jgi:multiple sugar transport system substrate-binding protein